MSGDTGLYLWASYGMGLALVLTELVLVRLRDKAIRGHLGWLHGNRQSADASESPPEPSRERATS